MKHKKATVKIEDSILHEHASSNDVEKVKRCLEKGEDINSINNYGNFAVSDTAMYGCLDVLDYLIKQGVELNYDPKEETLPFNYPVTPLMAGISASDHYKVTELLLKAGADPNIYEINGETPLHKARIYQKKDTEDLLVKWGAVEPIITEEEKFNMEAKVKAQNDHYDQKQRKEKEEREKIKEERAKANWTDEDGYCWKTPGQIKILLLQETQTYTINGKMPSKEVLLKDLYNSIMPELEIEDLESGELISLDEFKKFIKEWDIRKDLYREGAQLKDSQRYCYLEEDTLEIFKETFKVEVTIEIWYKIEDEEKYKKEMMDNFGFNESPTKAIYISDKSAVLDYAEWDLSHTDFYSQDGE